MIRLFILGIMTVLSLIITIVSIVMIFSLVKWTKRLLNSGKNYVDQQHKNWKARQAEKEVPDFLVQANRRMEHVEELAEQLPTKWKLLIDPLMTEAREMVRKGMLNPEQAEIIRSFYTVTLKAVEGFVQAMVDMQEVMQATEEESARGNIDRLMNDIYKYRAKLASKKRFDFHVMMEVVRQRLGK